MLVFSGGSLYLLGYTYSYFRVMLKTRSLLLKNVFTLEGGAMIWRSVKLSAILESILEAEYIAASMAAKEIVWLRKFYTNLGVIPEMDKPLIFSSDSNEAIANSKEPRSYKRAKHIERKYHIIEDVWRRCEVKVMKIAL